LNTKILFYITGNVCLSLFIYISFLPIEKRNFMHIIFLLIAIWAFNNARGKGVRW